MRYAIIALLSSALALAAPPAKGAAKKPAETKKQPLGEGDQKDEEESGADEEAGGQPEGSQTAKPSEGGAGTQHTVQKGDTLWDLSQRYLGSPWYWPKVWSYNPEIANPHWIYPGNVVRFSATGEEVPTQVETGNEPGSNPEAPDISEGQPV